MKDGLLLFEKSLEINERTNQLNDELTNQQTQRTAYILAKSVIIKLTYAVNSLLTGVSFCCTLACPPYLW